MPVDLCASSKTNQLDDYNPLFNKGNNHNNFFMKIGIYELSILKYPNKSLSLNIITLIWHLNTLHIATNNYRNKDRTISNSIIISILVPILFLFTLYVTIVT